MIATLSFRVSFFLIPTMTVAVDGARCRNEISAIFDTDKGTVISLVRLVISSLFRLFRAYIKYPT